MTRGRESNLAHLVATNIDDARRQWDEAFSRDRADLGPAHAAQRAAEDVGRYAPHRRLDAALAELRAAWTKEDQLRGMIRQAIHRRDSVAAYGRVADERVAEIDAEIAEYRGLLDTASDQVGIRINEPAIRSLPPGRVEQEHAAWAENRADAAMAVHAERQVRQESRRRKVEHSYRQPRGHGVGIGM